MLRKIQARLCLQVYKALLDDVEPVAVKFLNPSDLGSTASSKEKFQSEIQLLRLCMHDNIVACIGACVRPVGVFYSMTTSQCMCIPPECFEPDA